jgi:AraC family transcriptional regulator
VKKATQAFYEVAVDKAVARIRASLDEALDLTELSRLAALSPFHFHRLFRGMVGETPLELHRRLRLERAASALRDTEQGVTAIALDAGYETHEAFTRTFRAAYGEPPSAFRLAARARTAACERPLSVALAARSGIHIDSQAPFHPSPQGETDMDVRIEQRAALRLACVRHRGPYPRISEAFARLGALAGPRGLIGPHNIQMIAVYHDDPEIVPAHELRSDAALAVPEGVELPAGLTELRLPAGRYACTVHVGAYEKLGDTWTRLMGAWLPASGERVGEGVSYERYINDPSTAAPQDLRTELCVPLAE